MKNILKFISNHKLIVLLLFLLVLGGIAFISMKSFLYPSDANTVYGSRLDGINEVKIDDAKKDLIVNKIKAKAEVTSASVSTKGKIININIVVTKAGNTLDVMKEFSKTIITNFSEKELKFYDIQIFVKNVDANYNAIGYKNKSKEEISWVSDKIVSEVEPDEKA